MITDLSIIILSFNTKNLTLKCLEKVYSNQSKLNLEVYVVDNASLDRSVEAVKQKFPKVKIISLGENLGFGRANNLAMKKSRAKYLLLLNSDAFLETAAIDNLVSFAMEKDFAIASCKLTFENGRFQPNAGDLPKFIPTFFWLSNLDNLFSNFLPFPSFHQTSARYYYKEREVGWVSGTVMLVREDVINKIGLFDKNIFMYGEDVDFCWRAKKAGFKIGWTGRASAIHLSGGSLNLPKFNQWKGELKGLLYLYNKYYGKTAQIFLKLTIYKFILLRILAFALIGKFSYSKTYAKVITSI